jgi:hypothetical protein
VKFAKQERLLPWSPIGWVRHIFRTGGRDYLSRYSVFKQGPSGTNGRRVYLHHFMSEDDVGLHDHPFKWAFSVVLLGSYVEDTPDDPRHVKWFNFIRPAKYHRITRLVPSRWGVRGVWTLFVAGPLARNDDGSLRGWGFLVPGRGHVPHKRYIKEMVARETDK